MPLHPRKEPVRAAVLYALEHYCYEDAVFLAERLYDEVGDVDALYLLVTCHYRSGRLQQARHLLSKLGPSRHAPSDLLHATICLDLNDPNGALLALQSFLCFKEGSEADIAAYYVSDAAVAFWLLGRSHRLLHNTREAARHFRSCLKFNPFLWSAFEALSCMGEKVSPEECFTVSEYPPFLPPITTTVECPPPFTTHLPTSSSSSSTTTTTVTATVEAQRSENSVPMQVEEKQLLVGKKPSAFTPVDTNRVSYVTPELFAEPAVGKAIASSTPVPRALAFTRGCETTGSGEGAAVRGVSGVSSASGGGVDVGNVRMVLDFGSAPKTGGLGGGGGGGVEGEGTPMFGSVHVPPAVVAQGNTSLTIASPALGTPSQSTPSPVALPAHYTRQLLTAPVAPKKRVSHTIPPPTFKFSPTPGEVQSDAAKSTNQLSPSWSHDGFATPEGVVQSVVGEKKPHSSKMPLKSALRRSERLRKTSMVPQSQRKVGISNLIHSSNAPRYRLKSSGERSPRKGVRVSSTAPVSPSVRGGGGGEREGGGGRPQRQ